MCIRDSVGLTVSNMDAAMTGEVSCAVRLPEPDAAAPPDGSSAATADGGAEAGVA